MEEFQSIGYHVSQHILELLRVKVLPVLTFVKETLSSCVSWKWS